MLNKEELEDRFAYVNAFGAFDENTPSGQSNNLVDIAMSDYRRGAIIAYKIALGMEIDLTNLNSGITDTINMVRFWARDRNLIVGATSQAQTVKLAEEVGEVAAAVARNNKDALKDGIGDVAVVLIILAAQNGLTFEECLTAAYTEIKDRKGKMINGIFVREVE